MTPPVAPGPAPEALHQLLEEFAGAGAPHTISRVAELLGDSLQAAADPAQAVAGIRRVLESSLNRTGLAADLLRHPWMLDALVRITGASVFFTDILVRNPEAFGWLTAEGHLHETGAGNRIARDAARALGLFSRPERALDSLKRIHRRELLRIGSLDLLGHTDLRGVTAELSDLADVMIRSVWELGRREILRRTGGGPATPAAVIALGKLGGGELNYSSDIDLMVVYGEEGTFRSDAGEEMTHQEFFNRSAERLISGLSGVSGEGHLYRVDMRLRPEGKAGPLARSLRSSLLYYESRGRPWERQMLLKARPVAGDAAFGSAFLDRLTPFIHPRTQLRHPTADIARIKSRIEASLSDDRNVKLAPGGIRDIEFTVQALQLLHGGREPRVRSGNTLAALDALADLGLLSEAERAGLRDAYVVLRRVEHHLQVRQNTQTHSLPADTRSLEVAARRLGLADAVALESRLAVVRATVRGVYDSVMQVPAGAAAVPLEVLLEEDTPGGGLIPHLVRYGFRDPARTARVVEEILEGRQGGGRSREAIRAAAGDLLQEAAALPDPDAAVAHLALILGAGVEGEALGGQLGDPRLRNLLLTLCRWGARLPRMLVRRPLVLEALALEPGRRPAVHVGPAAGMAASKETVEAGALARFALGTATPDDVYGDLADGADADVRRALAGELRRRRRRVSPLLVLALGKYGTRERTVDADLDLLFLSATGRTADLHGAEEVAAGLVRRLTELSEEGAAYEVDARLRPEGRNAPLVAEPGAWRTYLRTRASLWERQALTRARIVAGEARPAARVMEEIHAFVYREPLPRGWAAEIVEMRRKTERRSRMRDDAHVDLKFGAGGMMDAEFLVQMLLLAAGAGGVEYHAAPLRRVLEGVPGERVPAPDRGLVLEMYSLFRRVELLMRLVLEDRSPVLPVGEKLERLAEAAGTGARELERVCAEGMRDVRRVLERTANSYASEI
jgi:glutamate-ammonia-ligase adenylyltransferase